MKIYLSLKELLLAGIRSPYSNTCTPLKVLQQILCKVMSIRT